MQWLNLNTSFLSSPEFVGSEPVQRGTWICLMAYCALRENGGVISACKDWSERQWMMSCGVTAEEANAAGSLWRFEGNDLHLWGYPIYSETVIKAKRAGGAKGGSVKGRKRTAGKKKQQADSDNPDDDPKGVLKGVLKGVQKGAPEGEHKGVLERNGMEWNGMECNGMEDKEKIRKEKNDEKIDNSSDDNDPPAPKSELEAIALRLGMRDFTGWYAYWHSMNWITAYGGIEHVMPRREIQRSMLNWKTNERKFEDEKRAREKSANPIARHKRPAGYIEAPAGKYTAENCGF